MNGKLAFVRDGYIYVMNADGSKQRRLTRGESPAWSPDGRRLAYVRFGAADDVGEIWIANADGTGARKINFGFAPAWSPDGMKIAFAAGESELGGILVMNADGGAVRQLTKLRANEGDPAWSPDGRKIAFSKTAYTRGRPNSEIY